MEEKELTLIHLGSSDYECPFCHAKINDEILYMIDHSFQFCPCCGEKVSFEKAE